MIFAHQQADGSYLITNVDPSRPPFVVGFDPGSSSNARNRYEDVSEEYAQWKRDLIQKLYSDGQTSTGRFKSKEPPYYQTTTPRDPKIGNKMHDLIRQYYQENGDTDE